MPRSILLVLDSVGCGAAADATAYGDAGADTLGHIAQACAAGRADRVGVRTGPLTLPNLCRLGLGSAALASAGRLPPGLSPAPAGAFWGYGIERSAGKDTPSGHWELAGTPVLAPWGFFPDCEPCFPPDLISRLEAEAGLPGILGDRHASGTAILAALGEDHLQTGKPICYTSADSVFQIAAHEDHFGLDRLYHVCQIARRLCDPLKIGRVIARPFIGGSSESFRRTANRRDYAVPPPPGNLLERAVAAGRAVVSIGKIGDIFAHQHTGDERKESTNAGNLDLLRATLGDLPDRGLAVANLVDFDSEYGHRRDVAGYAACLESFDRRLPALLAELRSDDLLVVTADHGNDPTFPGTDHTREHVPILAQCASRPVMNIGRRHSFADVGATLAAHIGLSVASGTPFLNN
jgi:phosphopentomutase